MTYLIIVILLFFLIYQYDYRRAERGRTFWLVVMTVVFALIGGLHYRIGLDYAAYENFYDKILPLSEIRYRDFENSRFAPGFVFLASFAKLFSSDIVLLHLLQASFVCGAVTWFFKNNTRNPFFALLLFFFFLFSLLLFEQIREAIAAAIFLLAWPFFRDKKWLKWYILSFCAMLFHTSATLMLALPLILLPGIKQLFIFGKQTLIISLIVFIGAFVIQASFFKYVQILAFTDSSQNLVNMYEGTHYLKGNLNITGILTELIRAVAYPIMAMIFLNKYKNNEIKIDFLQKKEMFVIISIYISLFMISVPIISRFNNYFFFFPIILLSDWIFEYIHINNKIIRFKFIYWIMFFIPLLSLQLYSSYFQPVNKSGTLKGYMVYYPYTSFIEKSIDKNKEKTLRYIRTHDN